MPKILVIGYPSTSLEDRALVLRDAGYDVLVANPRLAISTFLDEAPNLVVVCDCLAPLNQAILVHDIHAFTHKVPTVLVNGSRSALNAEAVLSCSDTAENMLSTVRRLLAA